MFHNSNKILITQLLSAEKETLAGDFQNAFLLGKYSTEDSSISSAAIHVPEITASYLESTYPSHSRFYEISRSASQRRVTLGAYVANDSTKYRDRNQDCRHDCQLLGETLHGLLLIASFQRLRASCAIHYCEFFVFAIFKVEKLFTTYSFYH